MRTTAGFLAKIVEALAPQPRRGIPWKCPQHHMRTSPAHHQMIDSDHPLNGGLRGYYQGRYPGYRGPSVMAQNSEYDRFPPAANDWGMIHSKPENGPTTPG
jgi:hypothetical protein